MMYYKSEITYFIYIFMKLIIISTYVTITLTSSSSAEIYRHGFTTAESLSGFGVKPNQTPEFQNSENDWTSKELLDVKVSGITHQPPFKKKRENVFRIDKLNQDNPVSIKLKKYIESSEKENIQKITLFKSPSKASYDSNGHAPNSSIPEIANSNAESGYKLLKPDNACLNVLGDFANASSTFIMCSVINSKPVRVCSRCVETFLNVKETYNIILKREEKTCKQKFFSQDRLMVVQTTYQNIVDLWSKGCCDKCLDADENGTLSRVSEQTEKFFNLSLAVSECFKKFGIKTEEKEANVCKECKTKYNEMNYFYESLKNMYGNSLCMDIIDLMNVTRAQWSEKYKCHYFKVSEGPVYGLTIFFGTLPFLFYTINRIVTAVRSTTLLQTKRLSQLQSSLSNSIQED